MNLICSSCGGNAPAKHQWWNQDRGYGICELCFTQEVRKMGLSAAIGTYGKPGFHHSLSRHHRDTDESHNNQGQHEKKKIIRLPPSGGA